MKCTIKFFSFLAMAVIASSCGTSTSEKENVSGNDTTIANTAEKNARAKKVFNSIPTPVESTSILKAAGAKYDSKLLNPVDNVSNYSSVKSKALNLGVYGADLSFISLFDQTQESILYLRCTNNLARGLGISGAFDENTTSRIESNMENKDSILSIVSESFYAADNYLVDNGQPGVSSMIVAGGWIEGLYISVKIAEVTKSDAVINKIGSQKKSLGDLVDLLESYKAENAAVNETLVTINSLKAIYDKAENTEDKMSIKMNPDVLKQITDKVNEIRASFIK